MIHFNKSPETLFFILALTFGQFKKDGDIIRVKGTRSKTGNMVHTTLTDHGHHLYARALDLWRTRTNCQSDNVHPAPDTPVLVVDHLVTRMDHGATGKRWNPDYFRHTFIDIKRQAGIEGKTFQDLRDTAITRMNEAGMSYAEIISRSQHKSERSAQTMIANHYGTTTLNISDMAAQKLNQRKS